jgi:hypothetical protein
MNFEDISRNWQNQKIQHQNPTDADQLIQRAGAQTRQLQRKKWWTIGIISLTTILLVIFFISVGAYKNWSESFGLSLMIAVLLFRIIIELLSKAKLQGLDKTLDFQTYGYQLQEYYNSRKWIHFVLTPIIYLAYFGGFINMLPVFKAQLSEGFYLYILISGGVVFIGLALFIGFHILKELKALGLIQQILKD